MYPRCVFLSLYKGDKGGYNFFLPKMEINSFNILVITAKEIKVGTIYLKFIVNGNGKSKQNFR